MKKIVILTILSIVLCLQTFAQTKKIFVWVETESSTVFKNNTFDWKPEIPYKHFVRLYSEIIEVPNDYYVREQFYEYLVKNNLSELKKMKLHKDFIRMGIADYDAANPNTVNNYKGLYESQPGASWQYEAILIKGFKYNPNNKGPYPLLDKAKKLIVEGKE